MTEQEKMLELLRMMAEEQKVDRVNQFRQAAEMTREIYESFLASGFNAPQALELTKTMITNCTPKEK